ncbi:hypothetical protein COOONC_14100 [Cooperia oncophora]
MQDRPGPAGQPGGPGNPGRDGQPGRTGNPARPGGDAAYCPCPPRYAKAAARRALFACCTLSQRLQINEISRDET